jgi:hypothetical protein
MKTRANFSDVESIPIGLLLFGETIKRSRARSRFVPLRMKEKDNTGQREKNKILL